MGRTGPMTQEHKAKIAAALRAYAAQPDSHLHGLHKSGPEHPNWKGGTAPRYYQRVAYAAHGSACSRCGGTRNVLVHHIDRDHGNSDPTNLEPLCRSCHSKEHGCGGDMRQTTHCPQGHEYTPENTARYTTKRGYTVRHCRICRRAACRAWYWREKEEAHG